MYIIQKKKQQENEEAHHREQKSETSAKQKEVQIAFLHKQLQIRDTIIEDQKKVMVTNNIPSRISYDVLKDPEDIADEAKIKFPLIQNNMNILYKDSSPRKNLNQFKAPRDDMKFPKLENPKIQGSYSNHNKLHEDFSIFSLNNNINNNYNHIMSNNNNNNSPFDSINKIGYGKIQKRNFQLFYHFYQQGPFHRPRIESLNNQRSVPHLHNNLNVRDGARKQGAKPSAVNQSLNDSQLSNRRSNSMRDSHSTILSTASSGQRRRNQAKYNQNNLQTESARQISYSNKQLNNLGKKEIFHPKNVSQSPYVNAFQQKGLNENKLDRLQLLNRNVQYLQNRILDM